VSRRESGLTFVARATSKARLEAAGRYTIRCYGHDGEVHGEQLIEGFDVIDIEDGPSLEAALVEADILFTAVGASNLPDLMQTISSALSSAVANRDRPLNLLLFENVADGDRVVRLELGNSTTLMSRLGVVPCLVDRLVTNVDAGTLDLLACGWERSLYDQRAVVGELPEIPMLEGHEDLVRMRQLKLFVTNMAQAAASALGFLRGHERVAAAFQDPEVRGRVDSALAEVFAALEIAPEFRSIDIEDARVYSREFVGYYSVPDSPDTIDRILADPIRKLQPGERFLGPALFCLDNDVSPLHIAECIAALLRYVNPGDRGAVRIQELMESKSSATVLSELAGLAPDSPLIPLVESHLPAR
jgi:mannitol-1-phosphate 5-dehydrogenase